MIWWPAVMFANKRIASENGRASVPMTSINGISENRSQPGAVFGNKRFT